jgi:hypothetical protein
MMSVQKSAQYTPFYKLLDGVAASAFLLLKMNWMLVFRQRRDAAAKGTTRI